MAGMSLGSSVKREQGQQPHHVRMTDAVITKSGKTCHLSCNYFPAAVLDDPKNF